MSARFLTKSRFKVGHDCPTKLYFLDDKRYGNASEENAFLAALAEGGFQVGELAKIYFEGGHDINTLDKTEALKITNELLEKENVIIYEAAVQFGQLFIRADILVKNGNMIELIEVKAKSFDPRDDERFYTKSSMKKGRPEISSAWEPYLIDVAFQKYVLKSAFPKFEITPFLMLADKSSVATVEGLNQRFILEKKDGDRVGARPVAGTKKSDLGKQILIKVDVSEEVNLLHGMQFEKLEQTFSFSELVHFLERICSDKEFVTPEVGSHCKGCEFRIDSKMKASGLESGFEECWKKSNQLTDKDFQREFVFEIWNFRRSGKLIEAGKLFIDQVEEEDISPSSSKEGGLSTTERQWLQVESVKTGSQKPYIDTAGLAKELKGWKFPLHFIDFETTMVAIPFHAGRRPYEQIAFQFSHHVVHSDGRIEHFDEYLNFERGKFPNFDFVRALKKSLSTDEGTIFRFAAHENTVLNQIKSQLIDSEESISDRDELIKFIESITSYETDHGERTGFRNMVDMCELVKKYFYHPRMKGSNSIKKVLPAVLECSEYIQQKYSQPIYGSEKINSRNFQMWTWVKHDELGKVIDPYKLLPEIFSDVSTNDMDSLILEGSIADGGAAMTAYARMQFTNMSESERNLARKALLKYCELDTFAMVLIFEFWKYEIDRVELGKAA